MWSLMTINIEMHAAIDNLRCTLVCKQICDNFDFSAEMSILGVGVTLHHSGYHGDNIMGTIILELISMYRGVLVAIFGRFWGLWVG